MQDGLFSCCAKRSGVCSLDPSVRIIAVAPYFFPSE